MAVLFETSNGSTGSSTTLNIGASGRDRLVVVVIADESGSNRVTSVSVDGKAASLAAFADHTANPNLNQTEVWYINETALGASNGTVNINYTTQNGSDGGWAVHAAIFTGVDPAATPIDTGVNTTAVNDTTVTVTGIDCPAGGLVLFATCNGTGGDVTSWTSPVATRTNAPDPSSAALAIGSGVESSAVTNKSYTATWDGNFNRSTAVVATFAEAGASATYTVTYDANGAVSGTVPVDSNSPYNAGATVTALDNTGNLSRGSGWFFSRWNTQAAGGSGTSVSVGSTFTINSNTTLYAEYFTFSYATLFDANGGSNPPGSILAPYLSDITLPSAAGMTPPSGLVFVEWNTLANGTGTGYAEGASYNVPNFQSTLYAIWAVPGNSVTYDGNGNTGGTVPSDGTSYQTGATVTVLGPGTMVRSGFSFAGWTRAGGANSGEYMGAGTTFCVTEDTTLTAVWVTTPGANIDLDKVQIIDGIGQTVVAPQINVGDGQGTPAAPPGGFGGAYNSVQGWNNTANTDIYHGGRWVFPSAQNITAYRWMMFKGANTDFDWQSRIDTHANGGVRFVAFDSSGNWKAWNIYGSDVADMEAALGDAEGFWTHFQTWDQFRTPCWCIDWRSTPDYSSGTFNGAQWAGFEVTITPNITSDYDMFIGYVQAANDPLVTSTGATLVGVANALTSDNGGNWPYWNVWDRSAYKFQGNAGIGYYPKVGLRIGNGATSTTFSQSSFSIGAWNMWEDTSFRRVGRYVITDDPRLITITQSASDSVTLSDGDYASSSRTGILVRGNPSGTCNLTRLTFVRYEDATLGHANVADCIFDAGKAPVVVNGFTSCSGVTVRNAESGVTALSVRGPAGNYSSLDIRLNNASATYDVGVGSGGPGTYDLRGITVPDGYTLRVRNESDIHAVTVQITPGITVTPSTAGGAITIDNAITVPVSVRALNSAGNPIEDARVLLLSASGGPAPSNYPYINLYAFDGQRVYLRLVEPLTLGDLAPGQKVAVAATNGDFQRIYTVDEIQLPPSLPIVFFVERGGIDVPVDGSGLGAGTFSRVILEGLTDANGTIENNSFAFTSNQPVSGRARKSSSAPFFRTAQLSGTISSSGLSITTFMIGDD